MLANDVKTLRAILPLTLTDLTAKDIAKAWSVIEWMVEQKEGKFAAFVAKTKSYWSPEIVPAHTPGKLAAQERAMKEVFSLDLDGVDRAWRAWVPETYRARPK